MGRDEWVIADPAMVEEFRKVPDDTFSFEVAARDASLSRVFELCLTDDMDRH